MSATAKEPLAATAESVATVVPNAAVAPIDVPARNARLPVPALTLNSFAAAVLSIAPLDCNSTLVTFAAAVSAVSVMPVVTAPPPHNQIRRADLRQLGSVQRQLAGRIGAAKVDRVLRPRSSSK